jgi:hypothetical protein
MPISDPRTQATRGSQTYCCPNCAAAAERKERGQADPTGTKSCAECGVAIVDESTMQTRVGEHFCCANCFDAMDEFSEPPDAEGDQRSGSSV